MPDIDDGEEDFTAAAAAAEEPRARRVSTAAGTGQMLVIVPPHPLIGHWLGVARNKEAPPPVFRNCMSELGRLLIYEAVRDLLPTRQGEIETPVGLADVEIVDPTKPVKIVPILRAGLVLLEDAATLLPAAQTFHLGLVRDEETLEASMYLNKLPERFEPDDPVLICDPMVATGGSLIAAVEECLRRGATLEYMRVVCVVCAPPALTKMGEMFKGLKIYTAMIDPELNEKGYIVPGLGDAGDRTYGTM